MTDLIKCCLGIALLSLFFLGCKKDSDDSSQTNPYDDWTYDRGFGDDSIGAADPKSFAGIYARIFSPSCANSGCHDGNFEPDFRTLESAYFSLINSPVIKPDSLNRYPYRVVPGNADESMLMVRMLEDLNGNSGIMPLSVDPGSDWFDLKEEHIQDIKDWIQAGAPDMFGNVPESPKPKPGLLGFMVTQSGSQNSLPRTGNWGAVRVPAHVTHVDLWWALDYPSLPENPLYNVQIAWNLSLFNLNQSPPTPLAHQSQPLIAPGMQGNPVPYSYRVSVPVSELGVQNDVVWMQVLASHNPDTTVLIPDPNAIFRLQTYCSIVIE